MFAALKTPVAAGCTSARSASGARLPSSSLTLNTIIQLARCHYGWWRNAKKRKETFSVSMRNDIMIWAPSAVLFWCWFSWGTSITIAKKFGLFWAFIRNKPLAT